MNQSKQPSAREVKILRNQLIAGRPFIRSTQDGTEEQYHVLSEVEVDGQHYALMHKHQDHPDEAYLFRIHQGQAEEIDDDAEWERIAEAVDEMLYFYDA